MTEEFKWSKDLTSELISNYEMLPILYNPCHPDYINRVKKADAFESLLNALKPFDPNITMDAIKRKIHTLRSQFSKEFRETEKSKKSGAGADDLHEPKLWCFDQLVFLKTHCKTRTSESNIEENNEQDSVPSPSYHSSTQDSSDLENDNTSKKKRKFNAPNIGKKINTVADLLKQKIANKSSYSWLGKQVTFEMENIQNEGIKRKASWAIQKILRESVEKDLSLRDNAEHAFLTPDRSLESFPSTSKNSPKVEILSVEQIRPPSSNSDTAKSGFTPDLLEQSMAGVFEDDDFI